VFSGTRFQSSTLDISTDDNHLGDEGSSVVQRDMCKERDVQTDAADGRAWEAVPLAQ